MTQDEIIEMAIQGHASTRDAIRWAMNQWRNQTWTQENWTEYEHSIAAKEREACAMAALDSPLMCLRQDTREACAYAIRARGEA